MKEYRESDQRYRLHHPQQLGIEQGWNVKTIVVSEKELVERKGRRRPRSGLTIDPADGVDEEAGAVKMKVRHLQ